MGGGSSKADSEADTYTETQLSEFALQYKNSDMKHLALNLMVDISSGSITTNTSDMPAALKALGEMCASLQMPLELADTAGIMGKKENTKSIGPFSQQMFKLKGKVDTHASTIYMVALADALGLLGWRQISNVPTVSPDQTCIYITFAKEGE
jgi:hypothetical protein